jgi:hypothetical protein
MRGSVSWPHTIFANCAAEEMDVALSTQCGHEISLYDERDGKLREEVPPVESERWDSIEQRSKGLGVI